MSVAVLVSSPPATTSIVSTASLFTSSSMVSATRATTLPLLLPNPSFQFSYFVFGCGSRHSTQTLIYCLLISRGIMCWKKSAIFFLLKQLCGQQMSCDMWPASGARRISRA